MSVTLGTLLELWHGDEEVAGYESWAIVVAACELASPPNFGACVRQFYPSAKTTLSNGEWTVEPALPKGALEVLETGFNLWAKRARSKVAA